jgi:hypothetical protein
MTAPRMKAALLASGRRTYQPVRRDSFDVEDKRAQVARPNRLGMIFVDAMMEVFDRFAGEIKKKGERHELNGSVRLVYRALLRCWDFKTGICEPCYDTLQRMTKLARATVVRAVKLLDHYGFLSYIRRTEKTGIPPGDGPQVKQVSNAYWFDPSRLWADAYARLQRLLKKRGHKVEENGTLYARFQGIAARRKQAIRDEGAYKRACVHNAKTPEEKARAMYPGDLKSQAEYLAMLKGASSVTSLNPTPNRSIQKE